MSADSESIDPEIMGQLPAQDASSADLTQESNQDSSSDDSCSEDSLTEEVNQEALAEEAPGAEASALESSEPASNEPSCETESSGPNSSATEVTVASQARASTPRQTLNDRPFRVKLRGSVLVLVQLPNKRSVRAAMHQLSTTGGVIHLEKPLDEKLGVELIFHIGGATVREKAQMLFPMWATQGWMQPFRFVEMSEAGRESLGEHLKTFMGEGAKSAAAGG